MSSPRTKEDWKARIEPHLSTSLRAVSDAIMRTDVVQRWLRTASTEAAEGLGQTSGLQGNMQGYMQMMNALEDQFPELLAAVEDLTAGCGHVDLHWRPMNPSLSRVEVAFDREFEVELFVRLETLTPAAVRSAIDTVAETLPDGTPFPNRPNTATGLVGHQGACLGIRVREHLADDGQGRYRTVMLLPKQRNGIEHRSLEDAARQLRQILAPADSSSDA